MGPDKYMQGVRFSESRHVCDSEGCRWDVYEVCEGYDRRMRALVFDSATTIRKIRQFPRAWKDLSDEALLALMTGG